MRIKRRNIKVLKAPSNPRKRILVRLQQHLDPLSKSRLAQPESARIVDRWDISKPTKSTPPVANNFDFVQFLLQVLSLKQELHCSFIYRRRPRLCIVTAVEALGLSFSAQIFRLPLHLHLQLIDFMSLRQRIILYANLFLDSVLCSTAR